MSTARKFFSTLLLAVFATISFAAHAQLADRKALTLEGAKRIAAAAEAEARRNNWNVVIAIVDEGGHLIYLQRMDGTQTGSIDVAIGKARTSAAFKRPTKVFDDLAKNRPSILTIDPSAVLLEGGVEIRAGNDVIGAIGVSGVTSQQDAQIAEVGIAALQR
ncbi:MAG TPA: heme-binding protein [Burkholderiales bacterium]|nr:heme-binding protein [Burkholderiales bacterium]